MDIKIHTLAFKTLFRLGSLLYLQILLISSMKQHVLLIELEQLRLQSSVKQHLLALELVQILL